MAEVVILGGGGNGLVVAQIIEDMAAAGENIAVKGFLNDHQAIGSFIGEWPVLGKTGDWGSLSSSLKFVFALLTVDKMKERCSLLDSLDIPDERLSTIIHPTATVSRFCSIGVGSVIASHVTCQPYATIGKYNIVRAGANIGHDAVTGNYTDIGPNATVCGYAITETGVFLGPNSVLKHRIVAKDYSVLGAGSVALKDLPIDSTWLGCPARRVK